MFSFFPKLASDNIVYLLSASVSQSVTISQRCVVKWKMATRDLGNVFRATTAMRWVELCLCLQLISRRIPHITRHNLHPIGMQHSSQLFIQHSWKSCIHWGRFVSFCKVSGNIKFFAYRLTSRTRGMQYVSLRTRSLSYGVLWDA